MRTTIKDIAKYTGFSITTISLVLNGKAHKIPKATEEAILQAAKELNYRPNQLAVGLVKKQTKTLGLILSDIRNNFFANMAKSIEDECRRNGRGGPLKKRAGKRLTYRLCRGLARSAIPLHAAYSLKRANRKKRKRCKKETFNTEWNA